MKRLFLTLALIAAAVPASAQTASLTLACTGTTADAMSGKPEDIGAPMGIVVAGGRVSFGDWGSVPITHVTPTAVDFHGVSQTVTLGMRAQWDIDGNIDRISGETSVMVSMSGVKNSTVTSYHLTCKPAQRLF